MRGPLHRPLRLGPAALAVALLPVLACTGAIGVSGGDPDPTPGTGGRQTAGGTGGGGVNPGGTGGASGTGSTIGGGTGGIIVPGSGGTPGVSACAATGSALNAGLTPARRLTRDQFNNTVRDLLGITGSPADALGDDEKIGPFNSNAIAQVDEGLVVQHKEIAATLAMAAQARMAQISPCDLATDTGTSTTCSSRFISTIGQRAYRRPLDTTEVQKYQALYALGKQVSAANGFRLVIEAMLQSPFFLYHHDVGATGTPQPGTVKLTPFELASRLSYFMWNSMPDDELFTTATNGTLGTDAVLAAQAQRLMMSDKAAATIGLFHRQWLNLEGIRDPDLVNKDAMMFPRYNAQLGDAMLQETALFADYVIRKGDGLLKTLLTSNLAFPQGNLFGVYGVTQPAGYTAGTPVPLNATQRAGLLTQAAFLTRWAHNNQTSPVHRGKLIRTNIMCGTILPPPDNANTTPPPPNNATTTRERFAQHASGECAACHMLMDPIGLGFEHYDAIGAYRTNDGPSPVNATGEIHLAGADLMGTFNGAVELANKLAQSADVTNCVASQWFRFSLGRMESTNDVCSMESIREGFRTSNGNVRELMTRIVSSPAFKHVRATGS